MNTPRFSTIILTLAIAKTGATTFANGFVAVTWGDDAVHRLDADMNDLGAFPVAIGLPNGVATDGNRIWVGSFTSTEIVAYDFTGAVLFSWPLPAAMNVQGLDYLPGGQVLAADALNSQLVFLDAFTGASLGAIPAISDSTEAIAVDGPNVWQLVDDNIYLTSLADGSVVRSIPNAALNEAFEGTAMGSIGDDLMLGSDSGNWFRVSKLDGTILASGNNALSMFDLQPVSFTVVPDAGASTLWLLALPAALAAAQARGRRTPKNH